MLGDGVGGASPNMEVGLQLDLRKELEGARKQVDEAIRMTFSQRDALVPPPETGHPDV
jgi:hypothetical protein